MSNSHEVVNTLFVDICNIACLVSVYLHDIIHLPASSKLHPKNNNHNIF